MVLVISGGGGKFVCCCCNFGHIDSKRSLHGFCFISRVSGILKALWIILSETINILTNFNNKNNIFWMPPRILPYILSTQLPLVVILCWTLMCLLNLLVVWVVFFVWECCNFKKIDENSFKSTNTMLHGLYKQCMPAQKCRPKWLL